MLMIRFRRQGKKNKPTFRVVVAEHSWAVNGKFTADLGAYNPHTKQASLKLDEVKIWLDKGAKPSNSVAKLLQNQKVKHKQVVVIKKKKVAKKAVEEKAEQAVAPEAVVEETPATETAPETTEASEAAEQAPAEA